MCSAPFPSKCSARTLGQSNPTCDAVQGYSALGNVMSLVGGLCSMCCSLLMPSTFYLILHKDLRLWQRFALMCIVVSGIGLVILVVGQNAMDLVRAGRASRHPQKSLTGDMPFS